MGSNFVTSDSKDVDRILKTCDHPQLQNGVLLNHQTLQLNDITKIFF